MQEMDVKHVKYSQWFRDVITANGEDILDVTFFTVELCQATLRPTVSRPVCLGGFFYLVTLTTKTATVNG
jgi:hypothetical protein